MCKTLEDKLNSDKYGPRSMTTEVNCTLQQSESTRMLLYNKSYIFNVFFYILLTVRIVIILVNN